MLDFVKGSGPYVWITAYDYPTARLVDEAGVDGILVGDRLGMGCWASPTPSASPWPTWLDIPRPWRGPGPRPSSLPTCLSYEPGPETALRNAACLVKAGADGIKLEGGVEYAHVVEKLVKAGIPVMGHIGLTPQRVLTLELQDGRQDGGAEAESA